ncbi:M14 family metallopeptidase, partial [Bacillus cereus group sp. BfR-BA-01423]|uniref:M14 family metallopeptidase n=1 Tax=Bacillus cereus group sp. BfR-BA-01423 TaxID=2920340 RepID=UPI001F5A51F6
KNYISGIASIGNKGGAYNAANTHFILSLPANAAYLRISIASTTRLMQLEKSTVGTAYEKFHLNFKQPKIDNSKADVTYVDNKVNGININRKYKRFAPDDISGFYRTYQDNHTQFSVDPAVTSISDFHTALNTLIAPYSDYITPTIIGKDSSGQYDIYKYDFVPVDPQVSIGTPARLPKFIIICGQHGHEKSSMFSLYYFIKDLLTNWKKDKILEYLRFNCRFVIVPCLNPHGFMNNKRENGNGVDLNRNYDYLWADETSTSKGTAPFSEVETQYVKSIISSNVDAIHLIDYHTNNESGDKYDNLNAIISPGVELNNYDLNFACFYHLKKLSREFADKYDPAGENKFFGYQSRGNDPTLKCYAASKGIIACTFEGFRKFPSESDYYSNNTIKANTENVVNWIADVIKHLRMENWDITKG